MLSRNFAIESDNPPHQLEYFDVEKKSWKKPPKASTLPLIASLVVAEKKLYAVIGSSHYTRYLRGRGANFDPASLKEFYEYDTKQNRWIKLPSMLNSHEISDTQVLYMDGFIYIIDSATAERFNAAEQRWEELPSLPMTCRCTSVISHEGKILVYGIDTDHSLHAILEYNLGTNMWQIVLSEQVPRDMAIIIEPVLFVYGDQLYRVMFRKALPAELIVAYPIINKLHRHIDGRMVIGEEVTQDRRIAKTQGAFCLQDQVFICTRGFVLQTDVKMNHGADDAGLTFPSLKKKWQPFFVHSSPCDSSNIVNFTFDKKKLGC